MEDFAWNIRVVSVVRQGKNIRFNLTGIYEAPTAYKTFDKKIM